MNKFKLILIITLLGAAILFTGCGTVEEPSQVNILGINEDVEQKILGRTGDDTYQVPRIDATTHALQVIDEEDHELHAGNSYLTWYEQTVSDIGDQSIITFLTDNSDKWVHVTMVVSTTGASEASIFEAPAVNDNTGGTVPIYNRQRNSPNTSDVWDTSQNPDLQSSATFFTEVTQGNVVGGTQLVHQHLALGDKKAIGGDSRAEQEFILRPNTLYAFILESLTNDDNTQIVTLDWYEHVNRSP